MATVHMEWVSFVDHSHGRGKTYPYHYRAHLEALISRNNYKHRGLLRHWLVYREAGYQNTVESDDEVITMD